MAQDFSTSRLRRLIGRAPKADVDPEVTGRPFGPETRQEAAARVTDPTAARGRVVVQEPKVVEPEPAPVAIATSPSTALPRFALMVVAVAAIVMALSQLREVKDLVAPVFFALNLMITAYPLQGWLVKRGLPRWLGSVIAGLAVLLVLVLTVGGLSYAVAAMVGELPNYASQFQNLYTQTLNQLTKLGFDQTVLVKQMKGIDPNSVIGVVTGVLSNASGVASLVVVILTTLIFLVMDSVNIDDRMAGIRRVRPDLAGALDDFVHGIRQYWLVSTVFGLVVAAVDYGILVGVGVPLALVWAMFSFLTNYIPNIGFVLGIIPPALLALVDSGWKSAVIVTVGYSIVNFVIQSIIQPRVTGDAVGLAPTMSFLSLLLWGWVFGGLGALIALPMSLLVKALLIDVDPAARWANNLISSRIEEPGAAPELVPPVSTL